MLFGAPISSSFFMTGAKEEAILALPGVTYAGIRTVAMVLIVTMCITTFHGSGGSRSRRSRPCPTRSWLGVWALLRSWYPLCVVHAT